jgi:hypothetical protein
MDALEQIVRLLFETGGACPLNLLIPAMRLRHDLVGTQRTARGWLRFQLITHNLSPLGIHAC